MQWSAAPNAGFMDGTPWIMPPDNFKAVNAEMRAQTEDSILNYCKRLIRLRKELPMIAGGKIDFFLQAACSDSPVPLRY